MLISDDELSLIFTNAGFDGRWSCLTRLLLRLHEKPANQLLMNTGWCLSPQNYRCPVCSRLKPALIRRAGGRVLALLHADHDHQADMICKAAAGLRVHPLYTKRILLHRLRYQPLLICGPCNHIDSRLKLVWKDIHPGFSLSPEEKASLILKTGRNCHQIDLNRGRGIWLRQKGPFQNAVCLWEQELADCSETGGKSPAYQPKKLILSDAARRYSRAQAAYNIYQEFHEFIRRSIQWQGADSFSASGGFL